MKLKYLFLVSFFLTACASTPNSSQSGTQNTGLAPITLPQDSHSQAITKILTLMQIPEIIRISMQKEFVKNTNKHVSEEYMQCIQEELNDNQILSLMIPVYKNNIDEQTTYKLLEFYTGPTGQKISTMLRIKLGESLAMPKITTEDVATMKAHEPLLDLLNGPAIKRDAETAGFNLGIQLGAQCVTMGSI